MTPPNINFASLKQRWYGKFIEENQSFHRTHTLSKWNHSGSTKAALKQLQTGKSSTAFSNDIIYILSAAFTLSDFQCMQAKCAAYLS